MQTSAPGASLNKTPGRLMMSDIEGSKPLLKKPSCDSKLLMAQC
jgi:hypothetical protein